MIIVNCVKIDHLSTPGVTTWARGFYSTLKLHSYETLLRKTRKKPDFSNAQSGKRDFKLRNMDLHTVGINIEAKQICFPDTFFL